MGIVGLVVMESPWQSIPGPGVPPRGIMPTYDVLTLQRQVHRGS